VRLVLAATLSPSYGIYSPASSSARTCRCEPGSEEYLDSEKYQMRRGLGRARQHLRELIARLNRIRRENPALQRNDNLRFHSTPTTTRCSLLQQAAARRSTTSSWWSSTSTRTTAVRLGHDAALELGLAPGTPYQVHDLLTGARYTWRGRMELRRARPAHRPAHVFASPGACAARRLRVLPS
jgi:starch synthase (maltosyl-transferring)